MNPHDPAPQAAGPIGVFDSGVGGLSVLQAMRAALPHEDFVYVADSGHIPYGEKGVEFVQQRSLTIARFLLAQRAKALVIACNTATAAAAALLRATFAAPIVAMEPAVKPAAYSSRSGVVGVLATSGTLASRSYADLVARFARIGVRGTGVRVLAQKCPGLVMQVEAGDLSGLATRSLVERYTSPLVAAGADTLVLGCTHFPFLAPLIGDVVGPNVRLIDSGEAVARRLKDVLAGDGLLSTETRPGQERFFTSGNVQTVQPVIARLWGAPMRVDELPEGLE